MLNLAEMLEATLQSTVELGGAIANGNRMGASGGRLTTQHNKLLTNIATERIGNNTMCVGLKRTPVVLIQDN